MPAGAIDAPAGAPWRALKGVETLADGRPILRVRVRAALAARLAGLTETA